MRVPVMLGRPTLEMVFGPLHFQRDEIVDCRSGQTLIHPKQIKTRHHQVSRLINLKINLEKDLLLLFNFQQYHMPNIIIHH